MLCGVTKPVLAFNSGDRVQCTADLIVHATASTSGTIITTEASGSKGTIASGTSQTANGYTWWYINWDNGYTGWSAQNYLQLIPSTPTITSVSPNPVTGSNIPQTFTVNGSGFVSGAQVRLQCPSFGIDATKPTTSFSNSQLQVSATFGNDPSSWTAQVINPGPVTSSSYNFTVQAPFPVIQSLSPSNASAGGSAFTLTVNGVTFDQGSVVRWNGSNRTTTTIPVGSELPTGLSAQISASDIASASSVTVTVYNPGPGGGTSSGATFTINTAGTITKLFGVDVSACQQKTIDWTQVKQSQISDGGQSYPVTFAMIRASKGEAESSGSCEFIDPNFADFIANANIYVGAYHVAAVINPSGGTNLPDDEADFFVSVAGNYIKGGNLRPALDVEYESCGDPLSIGGPALSDWVDEWMQRVQKKTGVWPILYCSGDYKSALGVTLAQKYDLWVAEYLPTPNPDATPNSSPWSTSIIYQYSGSGTVNGMQGQTVPPDCYHPQSDVDMDVFQGTMQDFQSKLIIPNSLPIELSLFTASYANSRIFLNWHTETEVNDYGFEIDRKATMDSPSQWNKIGFVQGSGTTNSPHKYSFIDQGLSSGRYAYRLKQIDNNGTFKYYGNAEVVVLPQNYSLSQNYPNPFNPTTTIRYALPQNSKVKIEIFNVIGQNILNLVDGEVSAGLQDAKWDASNVASGIYFYRLIASPDGGGTKPFVEVKKLQLLR